MTLCFIGLGSNLDNPKAQIESGIIALGSLPNTRLLARSRLYGSTAVGPGAQDDYINTAVKLETALDARGLLAHLQRIEANHGRRREIHWGARTLDLDLLMFGDQQEDSSDLILPHPRIADRPFVLAPLADLGAKPPGIEMAPALDYLAANTLWLISPQ